MGLSKKLILPFVVPIVAGISFYAITVIASDLHKVWSVSSKLGINGWLVILGLSLLNYGLRFVRWQSYLTRFDHHIRAGRHIAYYLAGFAFTTTPGKAGEAVRSLYLKNQQVPYRHSLAAFVVERFMDVVAMALLAMIAALVFEGARWPVTIMAGVVIVLLSVIHNPRLRRFLGRLSSKTNSEKLKTLASHLQGLLSASSELLAFAPLYSGLLLGILSWGAEGFAFYLILDYLGVHISVLLAVGIYAASILVGAISFLPGGLGSTEAVMVLLLRLAGTDTPTAIAATLICRIATLWFAVAIGLLAMGGLEISGSRRTDRESANQRI